MNLALTAKYKSIVHLRTVIKLLYVREVIFQEKRKSCIDRPYNPPALPPTLYWTILQVFFMCEIMLKTIEEKNPKTVLICHDLLPTFLKVEKLFSWRIGQQISLQNTCCSQYQIFNIGHCIPVVNIYVLMQPHHYKKTNLI